MRFLSTLIYLFNLIILHALTNRLTLISADGKYPFYRNQGLDLLEKKTKINPTRLCRLFELASLKNFLGTSLNPANDGAKAYD